MSYQITVTVKVKIQSQLEENSTPVLIADMLQKPSDGTTEETASSEDTIGVQVPRVSLKWLSVGFSDMFISYSRNPLANSNMDKRFC